MSSTHSSNTPRELKHSGFSRLTEGLGKIVGRVPLSAGRLAAGSVLYVDWTAQSYGKLESHGVVHNNFGGYVMSRADAEALVRLDRRIKARQAELGPQDRDALPDSQLGALHQERNQAYQAGHPGFELTRITRADHPELIGPHKGDILDNLAEPEGITRFIGWNDHVGIRARLAQLGIRYAAPKLPRGSRPATESITTAAAPAALPLEAARETSAPDTAYEDVPHIVEEDGGAPLFSNQSDEGYQHHTQYSGVNRVLEQIDGTLQAVYYIDGESFFAPHTQ